MQFTSFFSVTLECDNESTEVCDSNSCFSQTSVLLPLIILIVLLLLSLMATFFFFSRATTSHEKDSQDNMAYKS